MASFIRCWLIRGLIVAVLAAGGFGAWVVVHWVSPEKVREAVLAHVRELVGPAVEVKIESAVVRVFGGIRVTNLTLTRAGEATPFVAIPSAVIFHDKQEFNHGKLSIRKVELESPTLRLTRRTDGTFDFPTFPRPPDTADRATPTVVIRDATVFVSDADPDGFPTLALKHLKLHLVNDPQPVLKVDGQCSALPAAALDEDGRFDPDGFVIPLHFTAKWDRAVGLMTAHLDIPDVALRPELAPAFTRFSPDAARLIGGLTGRIGVKVDVTAPDSGTAPPTTAARVDLRDCRFEDARLPKPVEHLAGTIRLERGRVFVDKLTGKVDAATVELHLETKPLFGPKPPTFGPRLRPLTALAQFRPLGDTEPPIDPRETAERQLERFDLTVRGLRLDDALIGSLVPDGEKWRQQFNPVGGADVRVAFTRPDGGWRREVDILPNRLTIVYEKFRYPFTDVDGWLKLVTASDGTDEFRVQATGKLGDRRVTVSGVVAGDGLDPEIALKIVGTDIPIDARLIAAMPPKTAAALRKMRAGGRGDFVVDVRESFGVNRVDTTFRVRVFDGRVNYEHFPYALDRIRGNVMIRVAASDPTRPPPDGDDPDRVELRNFEAHHDGGRLWLSGESEAVPATPDRKLTLRVQGENCPIDDAFKRGLTELQLGDAVKTLAPRGEVTFGADMEVWERGKRPMEVVAELPGVHPVAARLPAEPPFNPATDLKLAFNFKGPTVTPTFFPYELNQLAGLLRFSNGRLELVKMSARHATSELKLDAAEVHFSGGGGVWANLGGMTVSPLVPDAAFLKALPRQLRAGLTEVNLRGGADLTVKHLVIKVLPTEPAIARGQSPITPTDVAPDFGGGVAEGSTLTRPPRGHPLPDSLPSRAGGRGFSSPLPSSRAAENARGRGAGGEGLTTDMAPLEPPAVTPLVVTRPADPARAPDAIVYWNAEMKLRGAALNAGLAWDDLTGTVASEGRYEGNHLGSVSGTLWLDKATVAKQPLTAVRVPFLIRPQQPDPKRPGAFAPPVVEMRNLSAALFQGTVGGQARVTLDHAIRYRLYLTASGVNLEELARHYKLSDGAELRGLAQGSLLVENQPDARTGKLVTVGSGQLDVPQGRMYNLPVLLDLVKVLKGQQPDGSAFEEAHATFDLRGDRVKVTQLDLLGSAVSLGGAGELDTDGRYVSFEFYTIWSQTLKRWLTTPLGDVTGLLSGSLFKIELTRENGKLTPKAVMLPVVTDPVRNVAERLRNRFGQPPPAVRAAPGR